jgi:hypothetical protein
MTVNLKLGDDVVIGGLTYVVATISGLPPTTWTLVLVPAGQQGRDLGKTWARGTSDQLTLFAAPPPVPVVNLETPAAAPTGPPPTP